MTVGPGVFGLWHLAVRWLSSGSVVAMFLSSGPLSGMLFCANCVPWLSDHGLFDAWIAISGPVDWRWPL